MQLHVLDWFGTDPESHSLAIGHWFVEQASLESSLKGSGQAQEISCCNTRPDRKKKGTSWGGNVARPSAPQRRISRENLIDQRLEQKGEGQFEDDRQKSR